MIRFIRGTVYSFGLDYVIIDCNGVGYYISFTHQDMLSLGQTVTIFTYQQFRNANLYVPTGAVEMYKASSTWDQFVHIYGIDYDPEFIPGDADGDGEVGIADATALIDYLLGTITAIDINAADLDSDGDISISDVSALIDMLLNSD